MSLTPTERSQQSAGAWRAFLGKTTNRRILGAALTITALTSVARMVALGKELIVAWRFGTGDTVEAFLIAFLIPSMAFNVIANSFSVALIPIYIHVREREGSNAVQKLLSGVTWWGLALLSATALVIVLSARYYLPWVASGFDANKLALALRVTYVVAPAILFSSLSTMWGTVLNSAERFALVALLPIVTPLITVGLLLIASSWGIFALAVGVLSGSVLEFLVMGIALRLHGFSLRPRWYPLDQNLRQVAAQFRPRMTASLMQTGSVIVDKSMAAMLLPGSVAALSYGDRLVTTMLSLVNLALGSAIAPYFSMMVARKDWAGMRHTLRRYFSMILVTTIPLTALLIWFSRTIVHYIYERGSFTARDTSAVSVILACYALQIPFMVLTILVGRLLASFFAGHIVMWGALIALVANVILNIVFLRLFGVAGIALATSCTIVITLCFTSYHAARLWRVHSTRK